jgi:hypothetical protein
MYAKILKIVSGLVAVFISLVGVSAPANAVLPAWPDSTFGNFGVFDSDSATTNSSDLAYNFGDTTGGSSTGVTTVVVTLNRFSQSGFTHTNSMTEAFNPPSSTVTVDSKVKLTLPASVHSYQYELFNYADRTEITFYVRNSDQSTPAILGTALWKVELLSGQITSTATSITKSVSIEGKNGSTVIGSLAQSWPSGGGGGGGNSNSEAETPTPAKYSGPEFSGLAGMGIMTGSTGKLEGKRLNEISSIEIGGKAATFTATSATELELSLPAGLAPGLYDLVTNSSAGKLTHINAIQVREPKKSFSITTRSTGKISNDQYIEHSLIAAMQIPELNKARCVVNANSIAMARAMANRLCAVVKASNPNIETTIVEPRSTVKGDAVFARVIYGWN